MISRLLRLVGITYTVDDTDAIRAGWMSLGYCLCFRRPSSYDVRRPSEVQ